MRATKVNAGLAESNSKLLLGIWRDSLHVTCRLTACTPGSAPGPTLGNEYGKTLPLTQVSQYQKGKTILDFTEARDSEWRVSSAGQYASVHLVPDRQPHQHPITLFFYRPDALPAAQPTASKH